MSKAALVSEMQKFRFGSKVVCSDGEYGTLAQVVFDSSTRCMTHISVKQGRLFGKTVLLPFDTITSAGSDGIALRIASSDIEEASHTVVARGAASHLRLKYTAGEVKGALLSNKCIVERADAASRGTLALVAVQPGSCCAARKWRIGLPGSSPFTSQARYSAARGVCDCISD